MTPGRAALAACAATMFGFGSTWAVEATRVLMGEQHGSIGGRVLVDDDGAVLSGATISLIGAGEDSSVHQTVATDEFGRFVFGSVMPGNYVLRASSNGLFQSADCRSVRKVALGRGQSISGLELSMSRGGVASGRVVDTAGSPLAGVVVNASPPERTMGKNRVILVAGRDTTDRDGRFRMEAVAPDTYYVYACPQPFCAGGQTRPQPWPLTFHPSAEDPVAASTVRVSADTEASHIEIVVSPREEHTLTGTVVDEVGRPVVEAPMRLFPGSDVIVGVSVETSTSRDGRFVFQNLPAGPYVLQAGRDDVFAAAVVELSAETEPLVLVARQGRRIVGEIVFDSVAPDFAPGRLKMAIRGGDLTRVPVGVPASTSVSVNEDWTFTATNVWGSQQLEIVQLPVEWTLKAIESHGVDHTDRPVDMESLGQSPRALRVTLTRRVTRVGGIVRDGRGRAAPGAHVVVFSTDAARWEVPSRSVRHTTTAAAGRFALRLPPGDYYVVAVDCLDEHRLLRHDTLETLRPLATIATLMEGRQTELDLVVTKRPPF